MTTSHFGRDDSWKSDAAVGGLIRALRQRYDTMSDSPTLGELRDLLNAAEELSEELFIAGGGDAGEAVLDWMDLLERQNLSELQASDLPALPDFDTL